MPSKTVPLVNNEIYHIFNRGVEKRKVFLDKKDYLRFYRSLYLFNTVDPVVDFRHAVRNEDLDAIPLVQIHSYSILPNHFHLILKQISKNGISDFMKRVGGGYTSYFNEKYGRSGALFQGRYKRVHVETDEQYRYLLAYVNENHYVHNIERDKDICYSSSGYFQGLTQSKVIGIKPVRYDYSDAKKLAVRIFQKRKASDKYLID